MVPHHEARVLHASCQAVRTVLLVERNDDHGRLFNQASRQANSSDYVELDAAVPWFETAFGLLAMTLQQPHAEEPPGGGLSKDA